ncbi:Predicted metal-dependent hydrolase of the TIM-barrel fold [Slackia heliotrinireducens]|uniref:Predicted TIM-barrel fold metal-dependent hydrolase n=1 Tax=Slackia heliotrinireducens (strain ATCC 29202 / DSM 20476 / NCTC 11029 / RHS 1) TaxID=471855 RepID=C7N3D3_SLAHD|nr:amidohydrolase family protein [Slackia heliotrinireducens]ACV23656.1 predicted TIM-barrel fold metal-dependent hydrolase [Slackia heliotrinireducens DSM 20476]VEH03180.1 Predicted metal-dependent hydrolase of the TIM-barrel fold [Slackia heliotrinireducens]
MPIVDAHAHIYPGKIAPRAVEAVGQFYTIKMAGAGTPEELLAIHKQAGITHAIVHSVATTPKSVTTINNYIAATCEEHPEFIGFGTMHQDFEDMEAEVERAIELGLHGFKLHPDTQEVDMDDPRLMRFYEIIAGRLPLVVHTGDYRYDYSHPRRLINVMKAFPDLVVDAAHLGGWSIYDVAFDEYHAALSSFDNLYVDASSAFFMTGCRHMRELIRMWGSERVMFGSDYPMWNPGSELDKMMRCELTEDELENVLWRTAERFANVELS